MSRYTWSKKRAATAITLLLLFLGMASCGVYCTSDQESAVTQALWGWGDDLLVSGAINSSQGGNQGSNQHGAIINPAPTNPNVKFQPLGLQRWISLAPQAIWQSSPVAAAYNVATYAETAVIPPMTLQNSTSASSSRYAPKSAILLYKAAYDTNSVLAYNPKTNTIAGTIPVGTHPRGLAATPDGTQVWVSNMGSNSVSVISTSTVKVIGTVALPQSQAYGIAITPDGTTAYVANGMNAGAVYAINVAKQTLTSTIKVGSGPFKVAVSPDGGQVWATNNNDGTVSVIDVLTNTVINTSMVAVPAVGVSFKPNGSRVYVTANDSFYVIDPASFKTLAVVPVGSYPVSATITQDGTRAFVCNRNSPFVSYMDLTTNTLIQNIQVGFGTETVSIIPRP